MTIIDADPTSINAPAQAVATAEEFVVKGDHARDVRDWLQARSAYERALHLNPRLAPIWIQLGHAAKESGDYAAAEAAYRKALEISPADADGHLQLGHLLKITGKLPEALEAYTQSVALDPQLTDAHAEIDALRRRVTVERAAHGPDIAVLPTVGKRKRASATALSIVFEVSDLLMYFQGARLPTGIQRVQMEVIKGVMGLRNAGFDYAIVCFAQERGIWVEIPGSLFANFCKYSISGGDSTAAEWKTLLSALEKILRGGSRFRFVEGSLYVDLGTSWWQRNYFVNLRIAKEVCGIRYIPFIHDLIPVMTPEYCAAELRRDFLSWIVGVLQHADYFLVNSKATQADLKMVAAQLGRELRDTAVISLDADFRRSVDGLDSDDAEDPAYFLQSRELAAGNYVLFVATVEARKNHTAAFAVWLKLIKKYGVRKVPKLVCVGKDGWLNDSVYNMLKASEILSNHVLMLQNISDSALAALYKNCLCTIYPTFYEGWGLPVTEALSYGKIPVVAKVSSLPEAGGEFAEYFDIGSENDLAAKVERLVFDEKYRGEREKRIAKQFRPRPWAQITDQVLAQLKEWATAELNGTSRTPRHSDRFPAAAEVGVLHSVARGRDTILWRGLHDGEIYRAGPAWWVPEDWGCWTKAGGAATLSFSLDQVPGTQMLVYVGLKGMTSLDTTCWLKCDGARAAQLELKADRDDVAIIELGPALEPKRTVAISIVSNRVADLASITEGRDTRVIGPGVRWFYVCRKDDLLARVAMAESLAVGNFDRLMRQPPVNPDFFVHT